MSEPSTLDSLRQRIATANFDLLALLSQRAELARAVQAEKSALGRETFDPQREQEMLRELVARNSGPFSDDAVRAIFQQIFRQSVGLMEETRDDALRVARAPGQPDTLIQLARGIAIGDAPMLIAGPCAVESEDQMMQVARALSQRGVRLLRGGAFKPRSSPYAFQGLGAEGLKLLRQAADATQMAIVSEVMDPRNVALCAEYVDVLQIGSRNMYNYDLLREVGRVRRPVLLKRGLAATIEEWLWSAEYILHAGNPNVIFCERGIRTFERETRNSLDISSVPILRQRTALPVFVDVTHAAGRRDILPALGRAALAAGAQGLMVEVHPCPAMARSDCQQQLDFAEFDHFARHTGFLDNTQPRGL